MLALAPIRPSPAARSLEAAFVDAAAELLVSAATMREVVSSMAALSAQGRGVLETLAEATEAARPRVERLIDAGRAAYRLGTMVSCGPPDRVLAAFNEADALLHDFLVVAVTVVQ